MNFSAPAPRNVVVLVCAMPFALESGYVFVVHRWSKTWRASATALCQLGLGLGVWLPEAPARGEVAFAAESDGRGLAEDAKPFSAVFGFDAERLALEAGGAARLRALKRAWTLSHDSPKQVAKVLDEWLSDTPKLEDAEAWATLRVLSELNAQPPVRPHLAKALAGELFDLDPESPYARLVPRVAALALAKSSAPEALSVLGEWLRRPSEKAAFARDALLAHVPADISPLCNSGGAPSVIFVETLGQLGDRAAIPLLREVVKRSTADVQGAAAVALARLGVRETQDLAALWLSRRDSHPALVRASAWIYLHFSHPARREAFERLTTTSPVDALGVAQQMDHDDALVLLTQSLEELPNPESRLLALDIVSRQGAAAVSPLIRLFEKTPSLRWSVAPFLAQLEPARVVPQLETWIRDVERRPAALATLSAVATLHREDAGLVRRALATLANWSKANSPHTRDLAKTGIAALDERAARRLLASDRLEDLVAASLAAPLHGPGFLQACITRLHQHLQSALRGPLSPTVRALSTGLSFVDEDASLSVRLLSALASSAEPVGATARALLWERSSDPVVAIPMSTGSAADRRSAALSRLDGSAPETFTLLDALGGETDAGVRLALVRAVRAKPELHVSHRWLSWTAQFDPDASVRAVAAGKPLPSSNLRAVLLSPPDGVGSDGYWSTVPRCGAPPATFYVHRAHPVLALLQLPEPRSESFRASDCSGVPSVRGQAVPPPPQTHP